MSMLNEYLCPYKSLELFFMRVCQFRHKPQKALEGLEPSHPVQDTLFFREFVSSNYWVRAKLLF